MTESEFEKQFESFLLNEAFRYNPHSQPRIVLMNLELFKLWEEVHGFEHALKVTEQTAENITLDLYKYIQNKKEKENEEKQKRECRSRSHSRSHSVL